MYKRQAYDQRIDTALIIAGSTVVRTGTRLRFFAKLSAASYLHVSRPCATWAHDLLSVDPRKTYVRYLCCNMYFFTFVSQKRKLSSVIVLLVHFKADKP